MFHSRELKEDKNKTIEGTGLGMSIVMKLLAMMNSSLEVKSVYGKGSEFWFAIEQSVVDWSEVGSIEKIYQESVCEISSYKEKLHAPKAKLLFVDDTEMNLEVIKGLLKKTGMQVDTALSGKEALELVAQKTYDIIFIDHRMPEMDGIETYRCMQKMKENKCKDKPCIMLTANAISGSRKMYLNAGFTDYISKPVNPMQLENIIEKYLPKNYLEPINSFETKCLEKNKGNPFMERLCRIKGLNVDLALKNCGSPELLESSIKRYYSTIDVRAAELERFFETENWKDYGIKVHALKSTSRLIGAMFLSKKAEILERHVDKAEYEDIRKKHSLFIKNFLGYKRKFAFLEKDIPARKQISETDFLEKMQHVRNLTEKYDLDGLDSVMDELSKVSVPEHSRNLYKQVSECIENVDFNGLKDVLEKFNIR